MAVPCYELLGSSPSFHGSGVWSWRLPLGCHRPACQLPDRICGVWLWLWRVRLTSCFQVPSGRDPVILVDYMTKVCLLCLT